MEFPVEDFDHWAETYDRDVLSGSFPFDGYGRVLETTLSLAEVEPGWRILDLGTGTGNLAARFVESGCQVWCTDFAPEMIAKARFKLPEAVYIVADMLGELPPELSGPFERVVSAYVFHHFTMEEKTAILLKTAGLLAPGGRMVIADIAFADEDSRDAVRLAAGRAWEEEYYWISDQVIPALAHSGLKTRFHPVSACAGVFVIQPTG